MQPHCNPKQVQKAVGIFQYDFHDLGVFAVSEALLRLQVLIIAALDHNDSSPIKMPPRLAKGVLHLVVGWFCFGRLFKDSEEDCSNLISQTCLFTLLCGSHLFIIGQVVGFVCCSTRFYNKRHGLRYVCRGLNSTCIFGKKIECKTVFLDLGPSNGMRFWVVKWE